MENENLILWPSFKGPNYGKKILIDVYRLRNIESITWYQKIQRKLCQKFSFDIYIYIYIYIRDYIWGYYRTFIWDIPYFLVYEMEAVMPLKVEIPSLRVLIESELEEADWVKMRYEQLNLISEKSLDIICHH